MNDRFKFRIIDKDFKKMCDVINIDFEREVVEWYNPEDKKRASYIAEENVVQATGLKDKNGKLIYEGDLLKYPQDKEYHKGLICEVFWHDNDCCQLHIGFQMNRFHFTKHVYPVNWGNIYDFIPKYTEKMEVIGNIYENPELLEVTNDY